MDYVKWIESNLAKADRGEKTKMIEDLAKRLGMSTNHFYPYKRGEIVPNKKQIAIMAEFFGNHPTHVKKPQPNSAPNHTSGNVVALRPAPTAIDDEWITYPVIGVAAAGTFREPDMPIQARRRSVQGEKSSSHPNATPMAWEMDVRDDSMNEAESKIFGGAVLIGSDFQETGGVLANDMIVVVERRRAGMIEISVKVVAILADRVELQPRSTNPIHQQPIVYKDGHDNDVQVRILTVVHGAYNRMSN
jgi:transcriptional regulator with XRE-family HTH domain